MEAQKALDKIRKLIINSKKPIMFFDCDADGGTSYLQLKTLRNDLKGFPMSKAEESQQESLKNIEDHDTIILFDTPQVHDFFFEEIQEKTIIWIDHHPNDQKSQAEKYNIVHFNPLDFDELDSRPSSYWAYRIVEDKKNLPLVVIGTVTDYYILDVIEELYNYDLETFALLFYGITEQKKDELFEFIKKAEYRDVKENYAQRIEWVQYLIFETNLFKLRLLFDFIYKLDYEDTLRALSIIEKTSLQELLGEIEAGKGFLFEDLAAFMSKLKQLVSRAYLKNKEKEFIIVEHKGKTSFNRHLIDELLYKCKHAKVIETLFFKQGSDLVSGSVRGKDGYAVIPFMVECLEGLDGKGGGHPYAGGFAIKENDFEKFQTKFRNKISTILS